MADVTLEHPATGHRMVLDAVRAQMVTDEISRVSPGWLIEMLNTYLPHGQTLPRIAPDLFITVSGGPIRGEYTVDSGSVLRRTDLATPMQFYMAHLVLAWIGDDLP